MHDGLGPEESGGYARSPEAVLKRDGLVVMRVGGAGACDVMRHQERWR